MTFPPLARLKKWLTPVTVITTGGRDDNGDILPDTSYVQEDCLISLRTTSDPTDRSSVNTGEAVLYAPLSISISTTDRIEVPEGGYLPGLWAVDGQPMRWPLGYEIPLRKE